MIEFFQIILVICLILFSAVFPIKFSKPGRSFQEASTILSNILLEIINGFFKKELMISNYPVYIGYNGYDIIPQNVEQAFKELYTYFEMIYFDSYDNQKPNRIIYIFKIFNPKSDLEYIDFITLIQKIIEKILVHHLRSQNIYVQCDGFIAVNIVGDILYVSIAKNNIGINETINFRRKIKSNYF